MKKFYLIAAALLLLAAAPALAQTQKLPVPSGIGTTNQVLKFTDSNNVQGTSTLTLSSSAFDTSITIGAGTAITKIVAYSQTVTPTSIPASQCQAQAVTVTGVTTSDTIFVNPAPLSSAGTQTNPAHFVAAKVSAADIVAMMYCNVAVTTQTPTTGTFRIVAIRS
jgi:hypothetical protein